MTNDPHDQTAPATGHGNLPRPTVNVVPAKPGLPAAGGNLDLLFTLGVDLPATEVDRKPLNLALVIDRSGSMSGQPLEAAKSAAQTAVTMLMPGDWVSVVVFDDQVNVVQRLVRVDRDRSAITRAIAQIHSGGSTNLFGGWAEGLSQVMACPKHGVLSRVIMLSDGMTNHGVRDLSQIAQDVGTAAGHGVTTTSMGLGRQYDEDLLRAVADAGGGNYVFLSDHEVVVNAFQNEVAGLSSLRGRGVTLSVTPAGAAEVSYAVPELAAAAGVGVTTAGVRLPDLVAGLPLDLLLRLNVAPGAGPVGLELEWDDTLTGGREKLTHPLELPRLSVEEWAAAPVNDRVALELMLAEIAVAKQRVAAAARRNDMRSAKLEVESVFKVVLTLPLGEERSREEAELTELRKRIEQQDQAMTARYSEMYSRQRGRGISDYKQEAMRSYEAELRMKKLGYVDHWIAGQSANHPAVDPGQAARTLGPLDPAVPQEVLVDLNLQGAHGVTRLQVVRGDITAQPVDVIVNSVSRSGIMASGVAGAIARAGGPELRAAVQAAPTMQYGEAVFTHGFDLPAKYVVHTAAQPFMGDGSAEAVLKLCYNSVFTMAARLNARSVALPAIGAGNYQFPPDLAAQAAVQVAGLWARKLGQFGLVRFVVQERPVAQAFVAAFGAEFGGRQGRRPAEVN